MHCYLRAAILRFNNMFALEFNLLTSDDSRLVRSAKCIISRFFVKSYRSNSQLINFWGFSIASKPMIALMIMCVS